MRRYGLAGAGAVLIGGWALMVVISTFIAPHSVDRVDLVNRLAPPSTLHFFGTDELGRDVFSRVLVGSQISLPTGLAVVAFALLIGTVYGAVAAYAGGKLDELMMRVADVFLSFPPLILAMAITAALGIGVINAIIAMVVVWWPQYARLTRGLVLVQRDQEYVQAARMLGYGPLRIMARHIAPNAFGPLIVLTTLDVGNAIITFAGLSFLGLGVTPPTPEGGSMVASGRLLLSQWWVAAFPGLAILSVVLGFNFLGDGLRDWLDPKSRVR
jgi:peptide/nickel transport system permease protein